MESELLTTMEVARALRLREYQIRHVIRNGRLRAPSKTASGDYLGRFSEVRALARLFDIPCPPEFADDQDAAPQKRTSVVQEREKGW